MTEISDGLRQFLTDWLKWAESGAPEPNDYDFDCSWGLCACIMNGSSVDLGKRIDVLDELCSMLRRDFEDSLYPFGYVDYGRGIEERVMHECPKRLAWVRKVLGVDQ